MILCLDLFEKRLQRAISRYTVVDPAPQGWLFVVAVVVVVSIITALKILQGARQYV